MKENPNSTLQESSFGSKEIHPMNHARSKTGPPNFLDEFSTDNQNVGAGNSTVSDGSRNVEGIKSVDRSDHGDSKSPFIVALNPIEAGKRFFTDKTAFECDTPELMVCYKDMDYDAMKDICIVRGAPLSEKILIRSSDDEIERPTSKSRSESHSGEYVAEGLRNKTEKDSVTTNETESDGSIYESFIDRALPIQEFGTRSFLRSFIISLDGEGNQTAQLLDQISSGKAVHGGLTESSAESNLKEDMQAGSSFSYNSMVESKIISFNFNSQASERIQTKEPSIDSSDALDHKNSDSRYILNSTQVHCQKAACTEILHGESLKAEGTMDKEVHNQILTDLGEDYSHDVFLQVPKLNDDLVERDLEKHKHGDLGLPDAGFITQSGPIPFSGSISFHSDGSATSAKSFAFPILQSEWNNSPVRMTKADRRRFWKHKFWRQSLLCCRF